MVQTKRTGVLDESDLNPSSRAFDDIVSAQLGDVDEHSQHEPDAADRIRSNMAEMNRRSGNGLADALRDREQSKDSDSRPNRDIGHQERAGWKQNLESRLGDSLNKQQINSSDGFLKRHKKGAIGWLIGIVMGGGMFGMGTALSGPTQWIQVMNFIKDVTQWVNEAQTGARYLHDLRTLTKWRDTMSDSIQNSRMGIVSGRLAETAISRMEEQGMSFDKHLSGNSPAITIDTTKEYGNTFNQDAEGGTASTELTEKRKQELRNKYGIPDKVDVELSSDGKLKVDLRQMSYTQARRFINATNGVGKFNIIGNVQTRMALKKVGKISWLHPIEKLKQKAINKAVDKFTEFLDDRIKKRALNGYDNVQEAAEAAKKSAEDAARRAGKSAKEIEDAGKAALQSAEEAMSDAVGKISVEAGEKIIEWVVEKSGGKVTSTALRQILDVIPVVGQVLLVIQIECMIKGAVGAVSGGIGAEKYSKVVAAAEGDTAETLKIGSEVESGHSQDQNISLEALENYTQLKLYNPDVTEISATADPNNAQKTNYKEVGTTSSSWWNAAPVKAALGETYTETERSKVPASLDGVSSSQMYFGGNKIMQQLWSDTMKLFEFANTATSTVYIGPVPVPVGVFSDISNRYLGTPKMPTGLDIACGAMDLFDEWVGKFMVWGFKLANSLFHFTDLLKLQAEQFAAMFPQALEFAKQAMAVAQNFYQMAEGWLRGNPLNLDSATPEQYGSINMYGGLFTSNEQMLAVGGRVLTDDEKLSLELDQKQYLAEIQSQKPLLSRLFDPTDYNSTIAQIGRAVDLDTSSQSVDTQLKNVGKIFASVPKLFSFALGKIGGSSSYADTTSYDYGVPMIAFSKSEMNQITGGDDKYNLDTNTANVFSMIDSGKLDNEKVKKCFGAEIGGAPNYAVTQEDNSSGQAWNYADSLDDGKNANGDFLNMLSDGTTTAYTGYKSDCINSDMLAVRTYLMDYATLVSADCYENNGWAGGNSADSCTEMGFTTSSSSTSATGVAGTDIVEPLGEDSSNIACAEGTTDLGVYTEAHYDGKKISIRACGIPNISNPGGEFANKNSSSINSNGVAVVNSRISGAVYAMAKAAGDGKLSVGSYLGGLRSYEAQKKLSEKYCGAGDTDGCNGDHPVAAPGTSNHEAGLAIDFYSGTDWLKEHAKDFGFCATVSSESWHYAPKSEGKTCYFGSD